MGLVAEAAVQFLTVDDTDDPWKYPEGYFTDVDLFEYYRRRPEF